MEYMEKIENKLVVQANRLIEASYKLKPSQQKFLRIMASMINKNDEDFKMYEFKINQLINLFEIKDQSKYKEIPKQTRELMGNILTFNIDNKIIQVPFLNYCEYELGSGILRVQFHPYLKPYYLYLGKENPYTKYKLSNILQLRSTYSIRIYELLKEYETIKNRTFKIDELRKLFQIKPTQYTRYNDFKRKVLEQAQKELPCKTDIMFNFEEIKEKRKVIAIKFNIKANKAIAKNEVSITLDEDLKTKERINESITKEIKAIMYDHEISTLEVKKIYDSAAGDLKQIEKVYKHFKNKPADDFVAVMVSMVKPGVFQEPRSNTPKTKFNDYDQRTYDYDELEKKLLGWDKEEINGKKVDQLKF